MMGLKENYYALMTAILNPRHTPETAVARFMQCSGDDHRRRAGRMSLEKDAILEMFRLKKTMTFKEIGELYGLSPGAIQKRMQRHGGQ